MNKLAYILQIDRLYKACRGIMRVKQAAFFDTGVLTSFGLDGNTDLRTFMKVLNKHPELATQLEAKRVNMAGAAGGMDEKTRFNDFWSAMSDPEKYWYNPTIDQMSAALADTTKNPDWMTGNTYHMGKYDPRWTYNLKDKGKIDALKAGMDPAIAKKLDSIVAANPGATFAEINTYLNGGKWDDAAMARAGIKKKPVTTTGPDTTTTGPDTTTTTTTSPDMNRPLTGAEWQQAMEKFNRGGSAGGSKRPSRAGLAFGKVNRAIGRRTGGMIGSYADDIENNTSGALGGTAVGLAGAGLGGALGHWAGDALSRRFGWQASNEPWKDDKPQQGGILWGANGKPFEDSFGKFIGRNALRLGGTLIGAGLGGYYGYKGGRYATTALHNKLHPDAKRDNYF